MLKYYYGENGNSHGNKINMAASAIVSYERTNFVVPS